MKVTEFHEQKSINWKNTLRHFYVVLLFDIFGALLLEENCENLRNNNVLLINSLQMKIDLFSIYISTTHHLLGVNLVNTI